jgi:hypothetical protein
MLTLALVTARCSDVASPARDRTGAPALATTAPTGITLDQTNGTLNDGVPDGDSGTHVGKGFDPTNPHLGDAIIATFFWRGSTNTITTVTDHLTDGTPVGNTYTLVEYVTAGGYSMATYVATNAQNFPDPNPTPETVLDVHAIFSGPVTEGGVMLSAYRGVGAVTAQALGAHASASGSGSGPTTADPGAIPVGAGALAYGVTMSNGVVGVTPPATFTYLTNMSDSAIEADGEYAVPSTASSLDPQWTWNFSSPSTWLATALTLNPAATRLVFTVQPSTTLPFMSIRPALQVTAQDDLGNPVGAFTGPVTIAIGRNGGMLMPGTLSGARTVAAVNGVATFSDLSIDQIGNGYTLTVTAAGVSGTESAPFNIGVM